MQYLLFIYVIFFLMLKVRYSIYIYNEMSLIAKLNHQNNVIFSRLRVNIIIKMYNLRPVISKLKRKTLFLAIAILDRYLNILSTSIDIQSSGLTQNMNEQIIGIACIFLAWKFIEVNRIYLSQLLSQSKLSLSSQDIIEKQLNILETIDFQIPCETAFQTLSEHFDQDKSSNGMDIKKNQIASRCLSFLKAAIIESWQFSICSFLGTAIYNLYAFKILKDTRMKNVFHKIRHKKDCSQFHCSNEQKALKN